jgi:hypothetical protein
VTAAFRIGVYDGNRVFKSQIGNPTSLEVKVCFNLPGILTMKVPLSHPRINDLLADAARVKVSFKGSHLISGPVTKWEGETDGVNGSLTVTVEDDFRVLREILGWPVPTQPATNQSGSEYRTYLGNAETIVKTVVAENGVTRLAVPGLTVATNLNRGATVPGGIPFRMHPLADQLFPAVETAGLGVTVKQTGTSLVLDVFEPVTHPRTLSIKGRTLQTAQWTKTRPKASRAVIGGPGDGVNRFFRAVNDTTGREAGYKMLAETFTEATDAKDDVTTGVTMDTTMDLRGAQALAEAGSENGISLTLAESGIFKYGPGGFNVGDRIPVDLGNGVSITEVLRECTLKWVSPEYASVEPVVGEITNQPERITAQRIAALAKGQRNQERR